VNQPRVVRAWWATRALLSRPWWPDAADHCKVLDEASYWAYVADMDEVQGPTPVREMSAHALFNPSSGTITFRVSVSRLGTIDGEYTPIPLFRVRYQACRNIPALSDEAFGRLMAVHANAILDGRASDIPCEHMEDDGIYIEEWNPQLIPSHK